MTHPEWPRLTSSVRRYFPFAFLRVGPARAVNHRGIICLLCSPLASPFGQSTLTHPQGPKISWKPETRKKCVNI